MSDKSLYIFLVITFGIGAIVILLISWLTPTTAFEKMTNTLFATIGAALAWMMCRYRASSN